jgi:tetratricopeptide (TPR) repeat protein
MRYIWLALMPTFAVSALADLALTKEGEGGCRSNTRRASERAEELLNRQEYREARSVLEEALRTDPSNPDLYALLGYACRGLGNNDKAMVAFTQAIRHNTREAAVFYSRGYLYAGRKEWGHAIEDYTNAIHLDPADPRLYLNRGTFYVNQRKYAKAREDYEAAWKRGLENPTAFPLARLLSVCPLSSVRNGRLAVKYAKIAYEQKQADATSCLQLLAAAHAEAGDWDEAVRNCERAIESAEESTRDLLSMLLQLYRLHEPYHEGPSQCSYDDFKASSLWVLSPNQNNIGKIMDAIKADSSGRTVEPNPELARVYLRLGDFYQYTDTVDAILHFNRCIELDPKNPLGFVGRSTAYSFLGKSQEAMADAKAALALSPKERSARCAFAWCLASVGKLDEAIREIDKLREELADNPVLHLLRGHCYVAQGHFERAVAELTEVIQGNPKLTIAYAERAVAFSALDKKEDAKRDLEECGRPSPSLREITEYRIKALHDRQTGGTKGNPRIR